jgi:hypothetical protein
MAVRAVRIVKEGGRTYLGPPRPGRAVAGATAGPSWRIRSSVWSRTNASKTSPR